MCNMDASTSATVKPVFNNLYDIFVNIKGSSIPTAHRQNHTVIKYTKIPEHDMPSSVDRQLKKEISPRVRRIVTMNNGDLRRTLSLQSDNVVAYLKQTPTTFPNRKFVTIKEEKETVSLSNSGKRKCILPARSKIMSNRSVVTEKFKVDKVQSQSIKSNFFNTTRNSKETKLNVNSNIIKKDTNTSRTSYNKPTHLSTGDDQSPLHVKVQNFKKRDVMRYKNENHNSKNSLTKNLKSSDQKREILLIKNELTQNIKTSALGTKVVNVERNRQYLPSRLKIMTAKEISKKKVKLIQVPRDERKQRCQFKEQVECQQDNNLLEMLDYELKDCATEVDKMLNCMDTDVNTDPMPETTCKETTTEMAENSEVKLIHSQDKCDIAIQTNHQFSNISTVENLNIPNVKLTKEKIFEVSGDKIVDLLSTHSLPNLQIPPLKYSKTNNAVFNDELPSYVIGHATVTYTTKQKIDFQVLGSNNSTVPNLADPLKYPLNIVSVFKKEMKRRKRDVTKTTPKTIPEDQYDKGIQNRNRINVTSVNCTYNQFNTDKLIKPSQIISSMTYNRQFNDYITEQFEKELNFIDSFFESLQYLENCHMSKRSLVSDIAHSYEQWAQHKEIEFDATECILLSKLEDNTLNVGTENEASASKSLFLLNLLISDEQRRARNLLFVLKMREDALKDFTKSQILWLENKKKLENTDVSTLKKKQRGALLKLQYECGEMQRMRKALLTLSEKRKSALLKTKRNIELKLTESVDVEKLLSIGKKKLRRSLTVDRSAVPLKCFELSASSCDDNTYIHTTSNLLLDSAESSSYTVKNVEKCIQTGNSIIGSLLVDGATDTTAENFVVVDGGYLNILFHNLSLPQIFSNGKQYEVNEEALKNILNSGNALKDGIVDKNCIEKFTEILKNSDDLSTPSTARSLVEEFDQYYKGLVEIDDSKDISTPDCETDIAFTASIVTAVNNDKHDNSIAAVVEFIENRESQNVDTVDQLSNDGMNLCDVKNEDNIDVSIEMCMSDNSEACAAETQSDKVNGDACTTNQSSSVTAAEFSSMPPTGTPLWQPASISISADNDYNTSVDNQPCSSEDMQTGVASPVVSEAEELRRQQLAIEREIKALEQQQCQLLAVREIPDKPPPPYTPPFEKRRRAKAANRFIPDESFGCKVHDHIAGNNNLSENGDPFDELVKDFCTESLAIQQIPQSDKPWDAYNILPKRSGLDPKVVQMKTTDDLREVLTCNVPGGMILGGRRADHIDDILFSEWRRCEPEWTSLHVDEAAVKNQMFESIFQKILSDTIDEYKKTVLSNTQII